MPRTTHRLSESVTPMAGLSPRERSCARLSNPILYFTIRSLPYSCGLRGGKGGLLVATKPEFKRTIMQNCVKYVDMTGAKTQTTILIIEDDVTVSENIALILEMEGFDVIVASDGPTGLAMIRRKKPHLILCDILMPEMDGYSVIEAVKKNPFCAKIPFLFISALNERDHVRKGMSNGADDYLTKPFSSEELLAAINARLQRLAVFDETNLMGPAGNTEEQRARLGQVTRREKEVLLLVGKGLSSKEIAQTLFISKKTVDVHRDRLMKKLGATNAASLASWVKSLND